MNTSSALSRLVCLAAYIALVLTLPPRLLAQTLVLDNYNAGDILFTASTTYGMPQAVPGVFGGYRTINFGKQDPASASSVGVGSGVLTFNAATVGDWFLAFNSTSSIHPYDFSQYNAFELTVVSAPAGPAWLNLGIGDTHGAGSGPVALLPSSGTVIVPFSWWGWQGVDFTHVMTVELGLNAQVPGTYVFDNFQVVNVPEPTLLALAGLGAAALLLGRRRQ